MAHSIKNECYVSPVFICHNGKRFFLAFEYRAVVNLDDPDLFRKRKFPPNLIP